MAQTKSQSQTGRQDVNGTLGTGLGLAQSAVYFTSGVWPVVHRRSFEAVTGPKVDFWLVRTVGLLLAVVGAVLGVASARRRVTPEMAAMSAGCAGALMAIDLWYAPRGRISKVYLLDAVLQSFFVTGWVLTLVKRRRAR